VGAIMKLYGIPNCDTVKKARAWLDTRHVAYEFVDFKRVPPTPDLVRGWMTILGRDALVNRRGTTWRRLTAAAQAKTGTDRGALDLLVATPSLIKRPVVEHGTQVLVGFDEQVWKRTLSA
jgi:Spx/MgsR family transcriptional regulator